MTQNFKTSEFDELFGMRSVKVPFAGAGYKELSENLERALEANPDIKVIVFGLDYIALCRSADWTRYEDELYPKYLYDDKLYNDVKYVFNKSVLFNETVFDLTYTKNGGKTTTFDEYGNWMAHSTLGRDAVLATYTGPTEVTGDIVPFTDADRQTVLDNLTQNVTTLADKYPDVEFDFFFTPYSIYYFCGTYRAGALERHLEIEKYAIELLLQHENIRLFSFFTDFDIITNPDNYEDTIHYGEDVNSQILAWVKEGHGQLTKENYEAYCQQEWDFYMNYDYDSLFPS